MLVLTRVMPAYLEASFHICNCKISKSGKVLRTYVDQRQHLFEKHWLENSCVQIYLPVRYLCRRREKLRSEGMQPSGGRGGGGGAGWTRWTLSKIFVNYLPSTDRGCTKAPLSPVSQQSNVLHKCPSLKPLLLAFQILKGTSKILRHLKTVQEFESFDIGYN